MRRSADRPRLHCGVLLGPSSNAFPAQRGCPRLRPRERRRIHGSHARGMALAVVGRMRLRGTFVLALGLGLGCSDVADASGVIDPPRELDYVVVGAAAVAVASNVTFTTIDVVHAVRGERLSRRLATAEAVFCGAQLLLLFGIGSAHESSNPYVLGYTAWTAALTAHGLVSLVTAAEGTPAKRRSRPFALAPAVTHDSVQVSVASVW